MCDGCFGCRSDGHYVTGGQLVLVLAGLGVQSSCSALGSVSDCVHIICMCCSVVGPALGAGCDLQLLGALGDFEFSDRLVKLVVAL